MKLKSNYLWNGKTAVSCRICHRDIYQTLTGDWNHYDALFNNWHEAIRGKTFHPKLYWNKSRTNRDTK